MRRSIARRRTGKEELLEMIRFGADSAVRVSDFPDGQLDIKALIQVGVADAE